MLNYLIDFLVSLLAVIQALFSNGYKSEEAAPFLINQSYYDHVHELFAFLSKKGLVDFNTIGLKKYPSKTTPWVNFL